MQEPTIQIRDRLLSGLDQQYNVVDMAVVVDVLSELENIAITKEALEASRLGKHINELRRKAQDRYLAARAKNLVKKWRKLLVSNSENNAAAASSSTPAAAAQTSAPSSSTPVAAVKSPQNGGGGERYNGHSNRSSANTSPQARLSPAAVGGSTTTTGKGNKAPSSSVPSSASTSPGLSSSRPTTPVNSGSRPSSRPVSPYNAAEGAPPRTNAANKRLRKGGADPSPDSPPAKRPNLTNGYGVQSPPLSAGFSRTTTPSCDSPSPPSTDSTSAPAAAAAAASSKAPAPNQARPVPYRQSAPPPQQLMATRRKTRRSAERGPDVLEQQMQSVRKAAGKVRTTQEIVQELALRSHSPGLVNRPGEAAVAASDELDASNESKSELMTRFFDSQNAAGSVVASPAPSPSLSGGRETPLENGAGGDDEEAAPKTAEQLVEDELAQVMSTLPVINASEVMASWEDEVAEEDGEDEDDGPEMEGLIPALKEPPKPAPDVTPEMVERLHESQVENLNGNFDHRGEFREWHEMLTRETAGGDILHVLPYSVIE